MYTFERTITQVHVRYKQPRTLGTYAQAELGTSVRTHAKVQKVHQYTCEHNHSCTLRTPPRLSMPYTVHVNSVRAQARDSTQNRCIAQTVPAKDCTRTCTVCTPKHAGSRTLDASLELPLPSPVHVHAQGARHACALTSNRSTAEFPYTQTYTVYTR